MSEDNPWKTVSSKYVYENPWIKVREDQVIRPDGKPGIYGVVETKMATGAVVVDENLELVLVGQYRYPLDFYSWEIIEGGADSGETPLEAAKRELLEEAGLIAENWQQLGPQIHLTNCHSSEEGRVYLAQGLSQGESDPEGTEVLQIRRVSFDEALSMIDRGEITDAMSLIGIERAKRVLFER